MIASKRQGWATRKYLTRGQVHRIHAFHFASFCLAPMAGLMIGLTLAWAGVATPVALCAMVAATAVCAIAAGTITDLMSMRIPDSITSLLLVCAIAWWVLEGWGAVPAEGAGNARDIMAMILPGQGSGAAVPNLPFDFPTQFVVLDVLTGLLVFIPLYLSFSYNLGFGGGDVKLMTALAFFLGWPLGFDLVILTYLFGGIMSIAVILIRVTARIAVMLGSSNVSISKISKVKSFPYAPAIALAGLVCIAEKTEGLIQ